eukprot:2433590-Pyramimonas_sp.AAC.2
MGETDGEWMSCPGPPSSFSSSSSSSSFFLSYQVVANWPIKGDDRLAAYWHDLVHGDDVPEMTFAEAVKEYFGGDDPSERLPDDYWVPSSKIKDTMFADMMRDLRRGDDSVRTGCRC